MFGGTFECSLACRVACLRQGFHRRSSEEPGYKPRVIILCDTTPLGLISEQLSADFRFRDWHRLCREARPHRWLRARRRQLAGATRRPEPMR